jgi:alkanesulfonate monooxygenase SsuD/methylene tetrahydromethanopterin reductase-like flavin-dependent oxidoreductase (luciferase family)
MSFHAYVAETHDDAVQGFVPAMRTYLEVFTEAVSSWEGLKSGQYIGYDKLVEAISSQTPEGNIEKRYAFVGTPAEVIEQVRYMRELFGEHEPSLQVTFGGISDDEALRTLDLFARHIMPGVYVIRTPSRASSAGGARAVERQSMPFHNGRTARARNDNHRG